MAAIARILNVHRSTVWRDVEAMNKAWRQRYFLRQALAELEQDLQ
jgi:hypothetical protein